MKEKAFQEQYPDDFSHCYGCGRLNEAGLHIKSYWDGDESVCTFMPEKYHLAMPGFVYGGLIASVIDCHSTATAAAAVCRKQGTDIESQPDIRFVTASLHVDYIRPTPIDRPLELRSTIKEMTERRVIISTALSVGGETCAFGEVVAAMIPASMKKNS